MTISQHLQTVRSHRVAAKTLVRGVFCTHALTAEGGLEGARKPWAIYGAIVSNNPAEGTVCATSGLVDLLAGAPFPYGAFLTCDETGRAVEAKPAPGELVHVRARAEQPAGRAGDLVYAQLCDFALRG